MAEIVTYTPEEVAVILKVTRRTLYSYLKEGKIPAVKMGKYWRISEENLRAYLSKGNQK